MKRKIMVVLFGMFSVSAMYDINLKKLQEPNFIEVRCQDRSKTVVDRCIKLDSKEAWEHINPVIKSVFKNDEKTLLNLVNNSENNLSDYINQKLMITVNVNGKNINKITTPLIEACEKGNLNIVTTLVKLGADYLEVVNCGALGGLNAFKMALYKKKYNILNFFLSQGKIDRPMLVDIAFFAEKTEDAKVLKLLSKDQQASLFSVFINSRRLNILKFLLSRIDIPYSGLTKEELSYLFNLGSKYLSYKKMKELLKMGVVIDYRDHNNMTPLMFAAMLGRLDLFKLLLSNGADITKLNKDNKNALDLANQRGFGLSLTDYPFLTNQSSDFDQIIQILS